MEDKEILVSVTNRNNGHTGYEIPDLRITRTFTPRETKKIPLEELKQLQYVDGGDYLLKHFLIIDNTDALSALNMDNLEPEYFYTETEIEKLLTSGTLDQLEDALNFAPDGVIDLIKSISVKIELPDVRKRKLISEKTGFSIDNAIKVNTIMNSETEEVAETEVKTRKAAPITAEATPARKAAPVPADKYKVVGQK